MKDRGVVCINYRSEGDCALGREGTYNKYCQHCKQYKAKPGAINGKPDLRKRKKERIERRDKYEY